jgi:bacteriophage exclusion system BrxC/D-like protein
MPKANAPERQVIESLRSGVPSLGVVEALGSAQTSIEERFDGLLEGINSGQRGLLIGGGFGSGKSHLMRHLGLLAGREGYVVSHVVVSKETPLYDPVKVAWSALDRAVLPDCAGPAIEHLAATLDPRSPQYGELMLTVSSPGTGLDSRFAAALLLYAKARREHDDFREAVVRFWAGDTLPVPEMRKRLRRACESQLSIGHISAAELARQRLRFAAQLMVAAGYRGWIVFFDEVELIARYPLISRAKAYAEIGRWFHDGQQEPAAPIGAVFALTDDFPAAVLAGKQEETKLPQRLQGRKLSGATELARQAAHGMDVIGRGLHVLEPPDDGDLTHAYQRIKELHAVAYGWDPPDVPGLERSSSNRMRQYVRAWINEWDLIRLDSSYRPRTRADGLSPEMFGGTG